MFYSFSINDKFAEYLNGIQFVDAENSRNVQISCFFYLLVLTDISTQRQKSPKQKRQKLNLLINPCLLFPRKTIITMSAVFVD